PVVLVQAAKVDRVEDIAVQDELGRRDPLVHETLQEVLQVPDLAVAAPQVHVRTDNGIEHDDPLPSAAPPLLTPPDSGKRLGTCCRIGYSFLGREGEDPE